MLWFDPIGGLNDDNTCGGCHSPTNGFGDTQSIAIGIDNNGDRRPAPNRPAQPAANADGAQRGVLPDAHVELALPRALRRPVRQRCRFLFPDPEGLTLSYQPHLLAAQAFIPPTERVEVAGFDVPGRQRRHPGRGAPPPERRPELSRAVLASVPGGEGRRRRSRSITSAAPIAEFEFTLVFADAPIDRYARGDRSALSDEAEARRAALLWRRGMRRCHAVSGQSNEMFSDFREHVIGVPQVAPSFGNVTFDGPGHNEDFGLEQVTGTRPTATPSARPRSGTWRSSRRSCTTAPSLASRTRSATTSTLWPRRRILTGPACGGPARTNGARGPGARASRLAAGYRSATCRIRSSSDLVAFVRDGLLDRSAEPQRLRRLIPERLPSGRPPFRFEFP